MSRITKEDITEEQLNRMLYTIRAYANEDNWKIIKEYESKVPWGDEVLTYKHQETIWLGGYGGQGPYHGAEHAREMLSALEYEGKELDKKYLKLKEENNV